MCMILILEKMPKPEIEKICKFCAKKSFKIAHHLISDPENNFKFINSCQDPSKFRFPFSSTLSIIPEFP